MSTATYFKLICLRSLCLLDTVNLLEESIASNVKVPHLHANKSSFQNICPLGNGYRLDMMISVISYVFRMMNKAFLCLL